MADNGPKQPRFFVLRCEGVSDPVPISSHLPLDSDVDLKVHAKALALFVA